jgi:hypothetical protein
MKVSSAFARLWAAVMVVGAVSVSAFTQQPPSSFRTSKVTTAASNRDKKTTCIVHVATTGQRHRQSIPVAAPILDEVCETVGVTLKSFMAEVTMLNPELTEMVTLFGAIDTSCKAIATLVRKS